MSSKGSKLAADVKFYLDYSKWQEEKEKAETWENSTDRVMDMHRNNPKLRNAFTNPKFVEYFNFADKLYKEKSILGSQRALQFGGAPMMKHNMKMYNCFDKNTEFITSIGVKKFSDFNEGDVITVLTHLGNWKQAIVKSYGKQKLYNIEFSRGNHKCNVKATKNHRWILKDGTETTNLKIGDSLCKPPDIFSKFKWEIASFEEKLYWCYGFVYGDGSINGKWSHVRLCGKKTRFIDRFIEMGFKTSSSLSLKGDLFAYVGKYLKTLPDPKIDSVELIRAFNAGYLDADGTISNVGDDINKFGGIASSNIESANYIRNNFPISGNYITNENDISGRETNYGKMDFFVGFSIFNNISSKYTPSFKVTNIEELEEDLVWCLEVEDDKSFVLKNGIVTGNCTSSYVDRLEFFNEAFWILLCGCGVGASIQKRHIDKLPEFTKRDLGTKTYIVEDSIEGWADALGVLMSSYAKSQNTHPEYKGYVIHFDYSQIRPKGAKIAGGFKAPGPEGLRKSLEKIENILTNLVANGDAKLRPIQAYDILMHTADAVLSGGVRRSATIVVFDWDDIEMLKAKTGNWFSENPQRARSNNSVILLRDSIHYEQFLEIFENIKQFGEPGFLFVDNLDELVNPCFNGETIVAVADGRNGVNIKQLAEENKPFPVYSGELNNKGEWKPKIENAIAFKTGTRKTIKVELNDGTSFVCTPEHKLAIPGGNYIMAKDSLNVELQGFFTSKDKSYRIINSFSNGYAKQHRLIWEFNNGEIEKGFVIDHKISGSPDFIDNLQYLSKEEHNAKTGLETSGLNNAVFKIQDTDKWKQNISNKNFLENNPRFLGITNEELINNARLLNNNNIDITFDNLRNIDSRTPKSFSKNRFGGNIQNLKDIINNTLEYAEPVRKEYIHNEKISKEYNNPIVLSISENIIEDVYDLKVENNSNFYILTKYDENYMNSSGILVHNCVEIGMVPYYMLNEEKISGWQGCNLTEGNGSKCTSKSKFLDICKGLAIIGTIQASYTSFPYLKKVSEQIFEKEALLGCSITGWMMNPQILFDEENMKEGARLIKEINKEVAEMIGINQAARTTCTKPSGNASVLLETSSGIHGDHSKRYFRNMQINKESEIAKMFIEKHSYMQEESLWSSTGSDIVVSFPVVSSDNAKFKHELIGVDLLEYVKKAQQYWVEEGTNVELCTIPTVRHNISNTIDVIDFDEVAKYIFDNRQYFSGVSMLKYGGDKDYVQAPFQSVLNEEEIINKYGPAGILASGLIMDGLNAFDDDLWKACTFSLDMKEKTMKVEGTRMQKMVKYDWLRRSKQFSKRYFKGNILEMTYCLKDVHLFHKWSTINRELKGINLEELNLKPEYTEIDTMGSVACQGGACELPIHFLEKMKNK